MERAELEALLDERPPEGREVEHLLPGVHREAAQEIPEDGRVEVLARQLLEAEDAARAQHPPDLGDRLPPVRDVVEDRELEDRVVAAVLGVDALGGPPPEPDPETFRLPGEALACARHRRLVEVEGVDRGRVEAVEDLLHAGARPAADLEHARDRWRAGGVVQPADGGAEEERAERVVDQRELHRVELHGNLLARWLRSATPPGNAFARWRRSPGRRAAP